MSSRSRLRRRTGASVSSRAWPRSPAAYLRDLGEMGASKLAAINLQFGLQMRRSENVKLFYGGNARRAAATS